MSSAVDHDDDDSLTDEEMAAGTPEKMSLTVEVAKVGPCRRHVTVTVPRADIERFNNEALKELITTAQVPGFRPGRVPRKLVERKFRSEVSDTVRQRVLMTSLEQVAEDHQLDAINEPDIDVTTLEIPETGDFTYQFDVEVRPEFDLPQYAGLEIERPVRNVTDEDVERSLANYLEQFGQLVPVDGAAEPGDFVIADIVFTHGETEVCRANERRIRLRRVLRFRDGEITGFDELMRGATPGAHKDAQLTISSEADREELRGETVTAHFHVHDVKRLRSPELTDDFAVELGMGTAESVRSEIRNTLERQVAWEQRQSARRQVLDKITESATWDLPESLVRRQVENALRREILEMQQAGFTDEQIRARQNELLQQQISMTRQALKEHFVLDRIATEEKIEVGMDDVNAEIMYMAYQRGESPRKMRARLERQGLMENLYAQVRERRAVEAILDRATFTDKPAAAPEETTVEGVDLAIAGKSEAVVEERADGE